MWHDFLKSLFFGLQNISNTFFQHIGTEFGNDIVKGNGVMCMVWIYCHQAVVAIFYNWKSRCLGSEGCVSSPTGFHTKLNLCETFLMRVYWEQHFFPQSLPSHLGFPSGSEAKNPYERLGTQETWVRSLGQEDPMEESMATCPSILAWRTPRTEESVGSQRDRHYRNNEHISVT